jgi:hypothetical protein
MSTADQTHSARIHGEALVPLNGSLTTLPSIRSCAGSLR